MAGLDDGAVVNLDAAACRRRRGRDRYVLLGKDVCRRGALVHRDVAAVGGDRHVSGGAERLDRAVLDRDVARAGRRVVDRHCAVLRRHVLCRVNRDVARGSLRLELHERAALDRRAARHLDRVRGSRTVVPVRRQRDRL